MSIFKTWRFWLGLALLLLSQHADYLWQASMHDWPSYLDLSVRAPHWGFWDFIPHDAWHITQSLTNMGPVFGAVLVFWAWSEYGSWHWRRVYYNDSWPGIIVVAIAYALARALGFTLVMWLYGVG